MRHKRHHVASLCVKEKGDYVVFEPITMAISFVSRQIMANFSCAPLFCASLLAHVCLCVSWEEAVNGIFARLY